MNLAAQQEHIKRVITGLIGAIVIVSIYAFFQHRGLVFIVTTISLLSYFEFLHILLNPKNTPRARSIKKVVAMLAAIVYLLPFAEINFFGAFILLMIVTLVQYMTGEKDNAPNVFLQRFHLEDLFLATFGLIYIVGFLSFVPRIDLLNHGPIWLLALVGIIWVGDSAAYYGGHQFGKYKLAPRISPGKTWEGAVFGVLGSVTACLLIRILWMPAVPFLKVVLIAGATAVISQVGDLFESMLKRVANVKDSGSVLPGHGGMLDRFDSLILASPFYYFLLIWCMEYFR